MGNLVLVVNNDVFTTSRIIAEKTNNSIYSVNKLISTHKEHLSEFGDIRFEIQKPDKKSKGGRPTETYFLNEQQTTLLLTFMRNSEVVIEFKKVLVKEFYKMKTALASAMVRKSNEEWKETREFGKVARVDNTYYIQKFIEYAMEQGSQSAKMYYQNFTKMENKALFILEGKFKNIRDLMTGQQLMIISNADMIITQALIYGMNEKMHYKDIYKLAKERVEIFASMMPKTPVPMLESIEKKKD